MEEEADEGAGDDDDEDDEDSPEKLLKKDLRRVKAMPSEMLEHVKVFV